MIEINLLSTVQGFVKGDGIPSTSLSHRFEGKHTKRETESESERDREYPLSGEISIDLI